MTDAELRDELRPLLDRIHELVREMPSPGAYVNANFELFIEVELRLAEVTQLCYTVRQSIADEEYSRNRAKYRNPPPRAVMVPRPKLEDVL
jgi:hypothetical protein